MASTPSERTAERLRLALELFASGEALMRQTLRRRYPDATDQEIESHLGRWLHEHPGAEHGDAVGVPGVWPRSRR